MKTILSKISRLEQSIELGLLTRNEAMQQLRQLRGLVVDKYEEGTDTFQTLIYSLIDVNSLIQDIY